MRKKILNVIRYSPFWLSLLCFLVIIFDLGFEQNKETESIFDILYTLTLISGVSSTIVRYIEKRIHARISIILFDILSIGLFITLIVVKLSDIKDLHFSSWDLKGLVYSALFLVFIREYASLKIRYGRAKFNPAQIFVTSFLSIIILGSGMLMLPNATHDGIKYMDALFTATSAVCVTGLIVVDTGQYFTAFGQSIILILIQIGGLGIMTFASYFSYFFKGGSSYKNQLMLTDITNSDQIGEVFNTLKKIIVLTVSIETIGAILIYFSLDFSLIPDSVNSSFFAVFHAVSAFCNAGFSTFSQSLYDIHFRFNYPLQMVIMGLFIVGGLGFPIVFNLYKYLKYLISKRAIPFLMGQKNETHIKPWVINLNSRIVLITTALLLAIGTGIIYVFEFNNTLAEHEGYGKMITALFTAATPRTAGFSSIDFGSLHFSSLMAIFLLMWVGASPASTGGGIKTSTFAIASLNFWSLARGKDRIEVFRREIANESIRRAFAIISLSLVAIGFGIFSIAYLDPEKDLLSIAFECFSAYSTVGLSIGITQQLSEGSKVIIVLLMFVGRVGMLYIMIAFLRRVKYKNYHYSKEEILIN